MNRNKLVLMIIAIFMVINYGYSVTQVISSCPVSVTNNTEYVFADNFAFTGGICFDMRFGTYENITIDGNNTFFTSSSLNSALVYQGFQTTGYDESNVDNLEIKNINAYGNLTLFLSDSNYEDTINDIYIHDNKLINSENIQGFIKLGGAGSSSGNNAGALRTYGGQFEIRDNYYQGLYGLMGLERGSSVNGVLDLHFDNLIIQNNDVVVQYNSGGGMGVLGHVAGSLQTTLSTWSVDGQYVVEDNNFVGSRLLFKEPILNGAGNSWTGNFDGSLTDGLDLVFPFCETDSAIVRTSSNSVTYGNSVEPTCQKNSSPFSRYENEAYFSQSHFSPNVFNNIDSLGSHNLHLILSKALSIDGLSKFIDMTGIDNSVLDLSNTIGTNGLTITNVRAIRMGTGNAIYGGIDIGNKPRILTDSIPEVTDSGYYGNDYQIIEFDNRARIENIEFLLSSTGAYSIIRKSDDSVDGIDLELYDNIFSILYTTTTPDRPQFLFGAFSKISGNRFEFPLTQNLSVFGGGYSGSVGGGHVVTDNTFFGAGIVFSDLEDSTASGAINYESKFIHNSFRKLSSTYSYPFEFYNFTENKLLNPKLNGTYYYVTPCTNYEFNLGNYYEDIDDLSQYNDSDLDGLNDDFIYRGLDYTSTPILDYESVVMYPFNFTMFIGNALGNTPTCDTFNYNIVNPTENATYISGEPLVTNWEFVSVGHNGLYCSEYLGLETTMYEDVDSGENNGVEYATTDGYGYFSVKCCDTIGCDNYVKESEDIYFCIGDCNQPLVVLNVTIPITNDVYGCTDSLATNYNPLANIDDGSCFYGAIIYGCTDSLANNYNPSANTDDGSCTYNGGSTGGDANFGGDLGLFTGDYESDGNSFISILGLGSRGLGSLLIIGFALLFVSMIAVIFGVIWALIGGKK